MKVGILTFHHTANYGATLQAFALYQTLVKQGHQVEVIDYRPLKAINYYLKELSPIRRSAETKKLKFNSLCLENLIKSWKMRRFLLKKMKLSQIKTYKRDRLEAFSSMYDVVICGSDQIWNIQSIRGFDPSYWLDFVDGKVSRKISYAASFGAVKNLGKNQEAVCKLINQLNAVSVRDSHSQQLIQTEFGIQAVKVLDPTFLGEYSDVIKKPKSKKKYLLIYCDQEFTDLEKAYVMSIASHLNLEIVSIGFSNTLAHRNVIDIGPSEWLGYVSEATYVITDHFHGTIFSILFKRPFTVFSRLGKITKLNDLLTTLELGDRIFSSQLGDQLNSFSHKEIDYDLVSKRLEQEILKSTEYLLEAIHGEHKIH